MGTVLPLHAADVDQAQIYLVDERGGLEQVVLPLAGHVPLRDSPQLAVDEGDQPLGGTGITRSPVDQGRRHIVGSEFRQRVLDSAGFRPILRLFQAMTAGVLDFRLPPYRAAGRAQPPAPWTRVDPWWDEPLFAQ